MGILDTVLGSKETTASAGIWPFLVGYGHKQNVASFPRTYRAPTQYSPAVIGQSRLPPGGYPPQGGTGGYPPQGGGVPTPAINSLGIPEDIAVMIRDDPKVAAFWDELAANQNNPEYMARLQSLGQQPSAQQPPQMPSLGIPAGIQQMIATDPKVAAFWQELAANQGNPDYMARLNSLRPQTNAYSRNTNPATYSDETQGKIQEMLKSGMTPAQVEQQLISEGLYTAPKQSGTVGNALSALKNMPGTYDVAAFEKQEAARQAALTPEQRAAEIRNATMYNATGGGAPAYSTGNTAMPKGPPPSPTARGSTNWNGYNLMPESQGQTALFGAPETQYGSGSVTTGGGNNLGDYYFDFEKNNTIPTSPEKGSEIPGVYPSVANEILNGPPEYYPYFDIAQKSGNQQQADDLLQYWTSETAQGRGTLADQQRAARDMYGLAGQTGALAGNIDPTFAVERSANGLSDFLNPYSASPYINQVINSAAADSTRLMNEMLLPKDRAAAISGGQYGGSRSGISEGITRRGVGEEITQMGYNTRYADYQNYLANKLAAGGQILQGDIGLANAGTNRWAAMQDAQNKMLGLSGDLLTGSAGINKDVWGQGMDLNDTIYKRGMMDQLLQQAMIDSDKRRWDTAQNAPMDWLERYVRALEGAPQTPASQTTSQAGILDYMIAGADALIPG